MWDSHFITQLFQGAFWIYKAGFPLANIFARSDFFPLSLSIRLKPSGTNRAQAKEKTGFIDQYGAVILL